MEADSTERRDVGYRRRLSLQRNFVYHQDSWRPPVGIVHTCTADGGKLRLKNCCLWIGQFDRCMPLASKEDLLSRLDREGQENDDANALCLLTTMYS